MQEAAPPNKPRRIDLSCLLAAVPTGLTLTLFAAALYERAQIPSRVRAKYLENPTVFNPEWAEGIIRTPEIALLLSQMMAVSVIWFLAMTWQGAPSPRWRRFRGALVMLNLLPLAVFAVDAFVRY